MKIFPRLGRRKGAALLLTLLVVGLLSASVIAFMKAAHLEILVAENIYAFTQAEILAQAGLKGAMTSLAMDDADVDSLNDSWARFQDYAALAGGLFEEGGFTGSIEDLSGKFNLNLLIDQKGPVNQQGLVDEAREGICRRLFEQLGVDDQLLPNILDWLDPDDLPRSGGTENYYYSSLNPPYPCGDGPLDVLGQFLKIKGATAKLLRGGEDAPGLDRFLTVHTNGKININTAPKEILIALDQDMTETAAQEIIDLRTAEPFEKIDLLKEVAGVTPEIFNRVTAGLVAVNSTCFQIRIEGVFREARAPLTAVVKRSDRGVELIYYRAG
ncbi:MAG: type II secretion system minor pseudopilin GspK [Pseudomonadota bacterium]